ncbi:MBL fold metallo-hydrolase [Microbacterium awajiense]|uniref:MBL fold metallo-hydrolase n=1 Tax=Microbacterium awajiense TaxID=415214 RepID=A0ABP7AKV3_9MICO
MSATFTVGQYEVTELVDGTGHLPLSAYPGADFAAYPELVDPSGFVEIRIGAYLVRGEGVTMLIDAGGGPRRLPFPAELAGNASHPPRFILDSGHLLDAMADVGVSPADIDAILLTHLHLDHVGWLMSGGSPTFPRADVYFGDADWETLVSGADPSDPARDILVTAENAGILHPYGGPDVEIAPGVRAIPSPGHTPGSHVIEIRSGGEELLFTGDLIEHPGQLENESIDFMTDMDRVTARSARAALWGRAKGRPVTIVTAHVPGPVFRRVDADGSWADATQD